METANRQQHAIGIAGVGLMGLGIATNLPNNMQSVSPVSG